MKTTRLAVVTKAVTHYWKAVQNDPEYTHADALTYALEVYDTGYELTEAEYKKILRVIKIFADGEIE